MKRQEWSELDIFKAKFDWDVRMDLDRAIDAQVEPYLKVPVHGPWLKSIRKALQIAPATAAKRMGIGTAAYQRFEAREKSGDITLASLRKCAEAIDCELVYAIRPKSQKKPSDVLYEHLVATIKAHPWATLWTRIRDHFFDPKYRREQGWARNDVDNRTPRY